MTRPGASRQICAWKGEAPLAVCTGATPGKTPFALPVFPDSKLSVRSFATRASFICARGTELGSGPQKLSVVSSEALDRNLLEKLAKDLGEITLYASGLTKHPAGAVRNSAPSSP